LPREAGLAGLAALVDPSEGAHGGNRVSPVKASAAGATRKKDVRAGTTVPRTPFGYED
jgi:hypothetical protein